MNVLVIGNGGREHAIIHSIKKSNVVKKIFAMPGNAGIANVAECIGKEGLTNKEIIELVKQYGINLTIVGPEVYIMNGIANDFENENLEIFCPSKEAGMIEGSKQFAKYVMEKYNIKTASYKSFDNFHKANDYVKHLNKYPVVVKYDGLAGGKGVYILDNYEETKVVLQDLLLNKSLGNEKIIIEEFLEGEEFTLMALVNGNNVTPLPIARDFKKVFNEDKGNNTGGMGCICPYNKINEEQKNEAVQILNKTANGLLLEGKPFKGVLYGGFISTKECVKVIEFNARFGDPETEVVLQRIKSDLLKMIIDIMNNKKVEVIENEEVYTGVVLTAKGYPSEYSKNIDMTKYLNDDFVNYHMSTKVEKNKYMSNGGRILCITNGASNKKNSFDKIYSFLSKINNESIHFRTDLKKY